MSDPKFTISKSKVLEQFEKVNGIADVVSYSSKTNPLVAGILEENVDCMFSVHLENELKNIRDLSKVIFLAQGWSEEKIKELVEKGIKWFVVDNIVDLETLENFLKDYDGKLNVLLRVRLKENSIKTERYFVFGMKSEVVNAKLKELRNNDKIGKLGLHFHRKTQNMAEWNLQYEIEGMLEKDVFEKLDVVNIGGGLPSEYANTNVDVIENVVGKIKDLKSWLNGKEIDLMVEPGRFIAAPAGKLVTEIVSVYDNNIIVNASVYNSDMDAVIVPVKLLVEGELEKDEGKPYVIKGITPCSMDLYRYKVYLSDEMVGKGKEIVFLNAGAYNFASDFCDLEKIETEIVCGKIVRF